MRAAPVVQVLLDLFYVLLHVLFYLRLLLKYSICTSFSSGEEKYVHSCIMRHVLCFLTLCGLTSRANRVDRGLGRFVHKAHPCLL